MADSQLALLTTLLLGIFILIGALLAFLVKRKDKVTDFSIGLAFGVIISLICIDLLPEIIETLSIRHIYIFIFGVAIGYLILKLLDQFIPDHDEGHVDKKSLKENLIHIGIITSLALMLHNIIEGMAVYSTVITNTSLGLAMTIGVGFHNIPLGMVITGAFYQSNENIWKTSLIVLGVSLTTFIGGLIMFFLNISTINYIILGTLLSITLGMLLFITISELLPRIKETKNKKITYLGIITGLIILLISILI